MSGRTASPDRNVSAGTTWARWQTDSCLVAPDVANERAYGCKLAQNTLLNCGARFSSRASNHNVSHAGKRDQTRIDQLISEIDRNELLAVRISKRHIAAGTMTATLSAFAHGCESEKDVALTRPLHKCCAAIIILTFCGDC